MVFPTDLEYHIWTDHSLMGQTLREKSFGVTHTFLRPDAGGRISATVKWYYPAKAYGFLVPQDGSPDINCRDSALAAVGLDTLLAGATVDYASVQRQRGPEVSRILAVDFSTASPWTASFARIPGSGRTTVEAGPRRRITALMNWFMPMRVTASWSPKTAPPTCSATSAPSRRRPGHAAPGRRRDLS